MLDKKKTEDKDIRLLEELLPKLSKDKRAYLKGATEALFYAQESDPVISSSTEKGEEK